MVVLIIAICVALCGIGAGVAMVMRANRRRDAGESEIKEVEVEQQTGIIAIEDAKDARDVERTPDPVCSSGGLRGTAEA